MNGAPVLDKSDPALAISARASELYVHRFAARTPVPASLFDANAQTGAPPAFVSVTRTPTELSIVAPRGWVAENGMPEPTAEHCGGPWTALKVRGPLEHTMVGVLNEITATLKNAGISIFAISTWDTDYILVTTDTLDAAKAALVNDGWKWA